MDLSINTLILLTAVSGYGDLDQDGHPSWAEREVHLWTNAARVDPEAFGREYQLGGCSTAIFSPDELIPKDLVYHDPALNLIARVHSRDMRDNNFFSHSSSDGTGMNARVAPVYGNDDVSENIARGQADGRSAVLSSWMCSTSGHRANIMSERWSELGAGVVASFYTQNFGGKSISLPGPIAMGNHTPEQPGQVVDFNADWQDAAPPVMYQVVLDGVPWEMTAVYGQPERGIYTGRGLVEETEDGCHAYFFRWESADGLAGTFPEEGSYLFGDCDASVLWVAEQRAPVSTPEAGTPEGCSAVSAPAGVVVAIVGALGVGRRRRR